MQAGAARLPWFDEESRSCRSTGRQPLGRGCTRHRRALVKNIAPLEDVIMSLWPALFGSPAREAVLPEPLQLDLLRLKRTLSAMGEVKFPMKLRLSRSGSADQLRQINSFLGNRLAKSDARNRWERAKAFVGADGVLPADVRAARTQPVEASQMLDSGCAGLGRLLNDQQIDAILGHLGTKPLLLAHFPSLATGQVPSIDQVPIDKNYACYDFLDLWSSPGLIQYAAQDKFLDLAQAYLGCTPTLYSINAFWSLPNRAPHKASQVFHRDWDDYRSVAFFTQLTAVDVPEDGAHYYVETSHDIHKFERTLREQGVDSEDIAALSSQDERIIAPVAMKHFKHTARRFDGPAGQSFCTDGYGLHRAEVPQTRPRLLMWIRFGNFFNDTMYTMKPARVDPAVAARLVEQIPKTPRHQYVFRHLIQTLQPALAVG